MWGYSFFSLLKDKTLDNSVKGETIKLYLHINKIDCCHPGLLMSVSEQSGTLKLGTAILYFKFN